MRRRIYLFLSLLLPVLLCTGCACEHVWVPADCINPSTCSLCQETEGTPLEHEWIAASCETAKTCSRCKETDGDPLGHVSGPWQEDVDMVSLTINKAQYCTRCDKLLKSGQQKILTLLYDGMFIITPREFMDRLVLMGSERFEEITYEFMDSPLGLIAKVEYNGHQSLVQFFHKDLTLFASDEADSMQLWCISLANVGISNVKLGYLFILACDPTLKTVKDAENVHSYLDRSLDKATENNELAGYFSQNQLLYESIYVSGGFEFPDLSMRFINVYASDFR